MATLKPCPCADDACPYYVPVHEWDFYKRGRNQRYGGWAAWLVAFVSGVAVAADNYLSAPPGGLTGTLVALTLGSLIGGAGLVNYAENTRTAVIRATHDALITSSAVQAAVTSTAPAAQPALGASPTVGNSPAAASVPKAKVKPPRKNR